MEKNRLEAFSDNLFAVVATLLVFELRLPASNSVWRSISMIAPKIEAFVLSFLIVAMYWVAHHTMFSVVAKVDRNLLWLNNLSLLMVSFIPFPTAVLGSHPFAPGAIDFYGLTLICVNVMNSITWRYAISKPALMKSETAALNMRRVMWLHLAPVLLYLVAIALGRFEPRISLAIFVLVPLFYIVPNPIYKRAVGLK